MVEEITVHSSLYTNSNANEKRIPLNVPYAKMNLNHFFISGAATGTHYLFLLFSSGMSVHESFSVFFSDISVCIVDFFFFSFSSQFICSKAKFFVFTCMYVDVYMYVYMYVYITESITFYSTCWFSFDLHISEYVES